MGSPAAYYSLILAITLSITGAHEVTMAFALSSTAFKDGAAIPVKHTCDGADVSPPLAWSGAPPGTRTFALIADDPDAPAGTWVHWVLYNLPATVSDLPEHVAKVETLDLGGARQGRTDFRRPGYGGPCPPPGPARRPERPSAAARHRKAHAAGVSRLPHGGRGGGHVVRPSPGARGAPETTAVRRGRRLRRRGAPGRHVPHPPLPRRLGGAR